MVQDAERMKDEDMKEQTKVQAKNEAENLCYAVEKQLTELKDKMSSGDKSELEDKMGKLRAEMAGTEVDTDRIQTLTKELQDVSWRVTQSAYQNSSDAGSEARQTRSSRRAVRRRTRRSR